MDLEKIEILLESTTEEIMKSNLQRILECDETNYEILKKQYRELSFNEIGNNIEYFEENIDEIRANWNKYKWLVQLFEDQQSQKVLYNMLQAKITMDVSKIEEVFSTESIYFDKNIFGTLENEVYIDCGAYTGDSILKFITQCPWYKKIIAIEAMPELVKMCEDNLQEIITLPTANITIENIAISDSKKVVQFDIGNMNGDSKISKKGNIMVEAIPLDAWLEINPTFIKMDVEGSELEAIKGAKAIIKEKMPKMAICIYHKAGDFWRIPESILKLNPEYKFKIRQHDYEVYSETVLYCIPNSQKKEPDINVHDSLRKLCYALEKQYVYSEDENKNLIQHGKDKKWFLRQLRLNGKKKLEKYVKELLRAKEWLEQQVKNQQVEINNQKQYIDDLIQGKEWLEQQAKNQQTEINNQKQYINDLIQGKEWLEQQAKNQQTEINNQKQYINDLIQGKEWLEQQAKNQQAEVNNQKQYIDDLIQCNKWLEEKDKFLGNKLQKNKQEKDLFEGEIKNFENEILKLKYKLNLLTNDKTIQKIIKFKKYQI